MLVKQVSSKGQKEEDVDVCGQHVEQHQPLDQIRDGHRQYQALFE